MVARTKGGMPTLADSKRVSFDLKRATAQEICLASSFKDWNPHVAPMVWPENGNPAKELRFQSGRYNYPFVVDAQRVKDPAKTELIPKSSTANTVLEVRLPISFRHHPCSC